MKYQIMYNPLSCNGKGKEESAVLSEILKGNELVWNDVTAITDYDGFLDKLPDGDILLISGGDGTLSRFVNILGDRTLTNRIDYFATGTGNDFMHDLGVEKGKIAEDIGKYLTGLPKVTVKGKTYRFFNGVGYGIDGYCCEVGDKMRAEGKTDINYAGIAIKGVRNSWATSPINCCSRSRSRSMESAIASKFSPRRLSSSARARPVRADKSPSFRELAARAMRRTGLTTSAAK